MIILKPYYINRLFYDCRWNNVYSDDCPIEVNVHRREHGIANLCMVYVFSMKAIENRREDIKDALSQLLKNFQEDKGHTVTEVKYDKFGKFWGNEVVCERLIALGIASGYVKYSFVRGFWEFLPDEKPYLIFSLDKPFKYTESIYRPEENTEKEKI